MTQEEKQKIREEVWSLMYDEYGDVGQNANVSDYVLAILNKAIKSKLEAVEGETKTLNVYFRSKFSPDCSRGETEEEKNTQMVELTQVLDIINKYK